MKAPFSWLLRHIKFNKPVSFEELEREMTSLGMEVEEVSRQGKGLEPFIVAHVLSTERHPDAQKLSLCKVDTGSAVLDVVCGAANVRGGLKVVFAPIGSIIPNGGLEIKKSVIRGRESNGMICSAEELNLASESDGIIELPEDAPTGAKFLDYMPQLRDIIFDLSITPNRGDLASIRGVSRDLAAKNLGELLPLPQTSALLMKPLSLEVELEAEVASFHMALVELKSGGKMPNFVADLLPKISNVSGLAAVDIMNFLMFDIGTPMHAYDASKVCGKVRVRRSISGEVLVPIVGDSEVKLPEGLLVIADEVKILALAGVMGDARSKVTSETSSILLEAASFFPKDIMLSTRATGINSDSSYRFARGVDFKMQEVAIRQAASLLGAGECSIFSYTNAIERPPIKFDVAFYKAKIGQEISASEAFEILEKLGCSLVKDGREMLVSTPSFRFDLEIREDIAEEIARIKGYDSILPLPMPNLRPLREPSPLFALKQNLASGLNEVITYSFFKDAFFGMMPRPCESNKIKVVNAISPEMSVMRDSLIPNLLENIAKNEAYGRFSNAIFEVGTVFHSVKTEGQKTNFAIAVAGEKSPKFWQKEAENWDIFALKSVVLRALWGVFSISEDAIKFLPIESPNLHPKQAFKMVIGKAEIGFLACVHPFLLDKFGVKNKAYICEVYIDSLPAVKEKNRVFKQKILPDVVREIAVIVEESATFAQMQGVIRKLRLPNLAAIEVLDIFRDAQRIGAGRKSVSLKFTISQGEKTLTKEEIDIGIIGGIIGALKQNCGALVRDGEMAK